MSNRFHNKTHRHNHHTSTGLNAEPDYGHDPIASHIDPFKGDLVINPDGSALSARDIRTNIVTPFSGDWVKFPTNVLISYLSAVSAVVNFQDILVSELSGFVINSTDSSDTFHTIMTEGANNLCLKLTPVSSTSWATFDKDLKTKRDFYVDGDTNVNSLTTTDIQANGIINSTGTIYASCGNSSDWCSTYTTVCANSATTWNYQGTDLKALSAGWTNAQTVVNNNSANWDSAYTTVCANSATTWNYQGTDLKALSAGWASTYTTVNTNSAAWTTGSTISSLSGATLTLTDGISAVTYTNIICSTFVNPITSNGFLIIRVNGLPKAIPLYDFSS